MTNTKPSLFAALLRTVADWAGARHGTPKSTRAERRRRARQRLKSRAAFADFFRDRANALMAEVDALQQLVDGLNADREQLQRQIEAHRWCAEDLVRRNAYLLDLCAVSQHEAEHWKRFLDEDRERDAALTRRLQLN